MLFIYDGDEVVAALYGGERFYYIKNAMGDVIAVIDEGGDTIVSYRYDAWGNTSVIWGSVDTDAESVFVCQNPFRYRSYYYDDDGFGAYYLQSRYYEAQFSRFLNADIPDIALQSKDEINGLNLFAYCGNDPINNIDPTGYVYSTGPNLMGLTKSALYKMLRSYFVGKKHKLTRKMLYHYIFNDGEPINETLEKLIIKRIKKSKSFKKALMNEKNVASSINGIRYSKELSHEFPKKEEVLYLSIHKCSYFFIAKSKGAKWIFTVYLWDTYDFTEILTFRNGISNVSLATIANDIFTVSYSLLDVGTPFEWLVIFDVKI